MHSMVTACNSCDATALRLSLDHHEQLVVNGCGVRFGRPVQIFVGPNWSAKMKDVSLSG